jgi:hypothetical protein
MRKNTPFGVYCQLSRRIIVICEFSYRKKEALMGSLKRLSGPLFLILFTALVVSACGGKSSSSGSTDSSHLPDFVGFSSRVRSYQFAVNHPDELAKYPCYCGRAMGIPAT